MTNELKTQWHPAFYSAMHLELKEDEAYLDFYQEYNLNTKPLEMDLLVIKKLKHIELKNEIGKLFRKYNILEYKSPKDSMNENTFLKVVAYAYLYKSNEIHVGDIELDEISITLVRKSKPRKLFQWLKRNGYEISERYAGIYYVTKKHSFPIQILVSKQLSKENQKWLTLLSDNLSLEDAKRTITQLDMLKEESEKLFGDSVLQVIVSENEKLFHQLRKDGGKMCEALRKIFEPELNEALEKERQVARQMIEQATLRAEQATLQAEQATLQAEQATLQAEQAKQAARKSILNALKFGMNTKDISHILEISLEEVNKVEQELLQTV